MSRDIGDDLDFSSWYDSWQLEQQVYHGTASPEAARRYFSAKYFLRCGVDGIFDQPRPVDDNKFFDSGDIQFPSNIWYRSKEQLAKALRSFNFPIKTGDGEPRLLVVGTNVGSGLPETFDSYSAEGVQLDHVLVSSSIPYFFEFRAIGNNQYCDGGVLSNTPLRELLQAHRDYWHHNPGDKVPDLELFIVGVWPRHAGPGTQLINFDEVKERLADIMLCDKTEYDEKVAVVVSDYIDITNAITYFAKQRIDPAEQAAFQADLSSFFAKQAQSKRRDGTQSTYGELLDGRARVLKSTRIECQPDPDSISNKAFDISSQTIRLLMQKGRDDAKSALVGYIPP